MSSEFLQECLIDADAEATSRRQKRRRRTLAVATAAELLLVTALVLLPVFSAGGTLPARVFLPQPFYPVHVERIRQIHPRSSPARSSVTFSANPLAAPTRIPSRISKDEAESSLPSFPGNPLSLATNSGNESFGQLIEIPEPPSRKPALVRRSEGLESSQLLNRVLPVYPQIAQGAHLSGTVVLQAIIGTDGRVKSVNVISGNPLFVQAAESAVLRWRYRPAFLDGAPVAIETTITIHFVLAQ